MASHSFIPIDLPAWKRAKWYDFGFLLSKELDPTNPPIVILYFRNYDEAKNIFTLWQELFGKDDPKNILRVTIAEGKHPTRGEGYSLGFGVNAENVPNTNSDDTVMVSVYSVFKPVGKGTQALESFKSHHARSDKYLIAPAYLSEDRKLHYSAPHALEKSGLLFRTFDSINLGDPDSEMRK